MPLVSAHLAGSGYHVSLQARDHRFFADEPDELGGSDRAPTPQEHLAAALAACVAITVRMYARRKQWPLAGVLVNVDYLEGKGRPAFECRVRFDGNLDPAQRGRLLEIAGRCPVHRLLGTGADVTTRMEE